jgi:guanosine-3',5'-bis(diphosphate) 3'-pyrophosphohydrolase
MEKVTPLSEILDLMKSRTNEDHALVSHAYEYAREAHKLQKRYSGAEYFVHLSAVGLTLAEMGMDAKVISAGLMHDTIEDAMRSEEEVKAEFGDEILFLIQGVTKLGKLKYRGVERHVESLRKLLIATAKDIRIIIIKLADRLHNVSTLKYVPEHKRERIALETLEIYAPIANRLSLGSIKGLLEDYSFPYAYPNEYEKVETIIADQMHNNKKRIEKFYRTMQQELAKNEITDIQGSFRVKRTYSLYKKLCKHDMNIENIHDILAIRIIVPTIGECYRALGVAHSLWRPLPGRIKDYIAFPKPNGYQSLHTTVFTGDGGFLEVQIRTKEMDQEAALGVAAHFAYKENVNLAGKELPSKYAWVKEVGKLKEVSTTGDYMKALKTDFFDDRVFVFTPKGDVVDLPTNSTPIDFAYAIHTDIGDHFSGAKVNGKLVSLDTFLKYGDIVGIEVKRSAKPSRKWLQYAKTAHAKKHIQNYINETNSLN